VKKQQLTKVTLFVAKTGKFKNTKQKKTQLKLLNEAKHFLSKELGCMIEIVDSDLSDHKKADIATPEKLGILVE
jgi:ribosome-binding factor A